MRKHRATYPDLANHNRRRRDLPGIYVGRVSEIGKGNTNASRELVIQLVLALCSDVDKAKVVLHDPEPQQSIRREPHQLAKVR